MTKNQRTKLGAREKRVTDVISEAPAGVKKTLQEAFFAVASPRRAIKAQCLVCVGYDRDAIRNCTGFGCPLWSYRPYQHGSR